MNGVPEILVLKLLSHRDMYGYELVRSIRESTDDTVSVGEGCVYPILHALERDGHLSSYKDKIDGRQRLYYQLTKPGKSRLDAMTKQWRDITGAVATVLGDTQSVPTTA